MTTRPGPSGAADAEIRKALQEALHAGLQQWQLRTGHTLQFWLRGYCACFAETLATLLGKPASLGSVLANDGNVHHVVVVLGDLVIDARGVGTKESLLAEINSEAQARNYLLRAIDVVPFEFEHGHFLKACDDSELRALRACLNTPAIHRVRHRARIFSSSKKSGEPVKTEGARPTRNPRPKDG
jgi:hypothetical protein